MAGNAIAQGNVLISLNADQFAGGLKKTEGGLKSFVDKASTVTGSGFLKGFGSALKAGGPVALAGFAVEAGMGAIDMAKNFATSLVGEVEDIGKQGVIAKAMGIDPSAFTGIAGVAKSAGEDTREFIESLVTMGKLGSDAAAGVGEVAGPAFEKLGLNAKEFVKLSPDKQFYSMFEALHKVGPGLDQTRLLMNAFGEDGGKYLLPLLAKTPEELRKMGMQFALTGEQIKKAEAASTAITSLKNTFDQGWKRLAVAAAPVINAVAKGFMGLIDFVQPFFNWLERGWNKVTEVGTLFWDAIVGAAKDAWTWTQQAFSGLFDWVGEVPTLEDVVVAFFRGVGIAAAWAWDVIKAGAGIVTVAAGAIVKSFGFVVEGFEEIIKLGKDLPEEMKPAGFDKFAESVTGFRSAVAKKGDDMIKWGSTAVLNFGKSGEEFNSWLDKALIKTKEVGGEIAAVTAGDMTTSPLKLSGAVLKGSKEAYSLAIKNQYRDLMKDGDSAKKTAKEAEKIRKSSEKNEKNTGGILKFMEGLGKV